MYLYFFFDLQMPHLDQWPLLNQLSADLGSGWRENVIHGVTFCDGCRAYTSEEGKARLALQKLTLDVDYVTTLDLRILCIQQRLKLLLLLQQKRQQQRRRDQRRKRCGAAEEEVVNNKRRK